MKNNSFSEIAAVLEKADSVLILTHVIIDGDSAGTASALCRALTSLGKTAHIYTGEELPSNISILDYSGFVKNPGNLLDTYDVTVAVDCSDMTRFENRMNYYERGGIKVNIDHHATNTYYAEFNYVDSDACAAGEIIYKFMKSAGWTVDAKTAEAVYVAIVTDSGRFQYSSTTPETHRIAAELLETGIDLNTISVAVYQNVKKSKYILQGEMMQTIEFRENDRFAIAFADTEMFERTGTEIQDSDGFIELLRDIDTVEVAAFVKQTAPDVMKLGFRSKYDMDVAAIASKFGGGGHKKAAGCSIRGGIQDVKDALYPEISKIFKERDNN